MLGLKYYFEKNQTFNALKKDLDTRKKAIKAAMTGTTEVDEDGYRAEITKQDRSAMNDEKLVKMLKRKGFLEAIKTIHVSIPEEVEKLTYDGALTPEEIASCMESKLVEVFKVKKV